MSTPLQSTALPTELSKDANNALRIECFIPQWEESEVEPQGTLLSCTEKQSSKTYLCRRTPTHPFPAPATTWINLLPSRPVHISHREREKKNTQSDIKMATPGTIISLSAVVLPRVWKGRVMTLGSTHYTTERLITREITARSQN